MDERTRRIAWCVTSAHETGTPRLDYDAVAVLPDGAGISYGAHQATDGSGTLDQIVARYIAAGGQYADDLEPYLAQLADPDVPLASSGEFRTLLRLVGQDPAMHRVQDAVFAEQYWRPVVSYARRRGLVLPLSYVSLYDLAVHSGHGRVGALRKHFQARPPDRGGDERTWSMGIMRARREWLRAYSHTDPVKQRIVRQSAYRADTYLDLAAGDWALPLPLTAHVGRGTVQVADADLASVAELP